MMPRDEYEFTAGRWAGAVTALYTLNEAEAEKQFGLWPDPKDHVPTGSAEEWRRFMKLMAEHTLQLLAAAPF